MDIKKILQKIDQVNEGYWDSEDGPDYDDDGFNPNRFRQSGSALHPGTKDDPIDQPCPTCGEEDVLTRRDVAKGYQCDTCADRAEGKIQWESKKPSLKDYFHKIDEDTTSGMKPLPMLDPKNQQVGAAVVTSKNPTIQKILKNLTPQDVQVVQTMTKTGQPNQSGTQSTGTNTSTTTGTSAGSMQPMKESDGEPTINGKLVDVYSLDFDDIDTKDYPDFADAYVVSGSFEDGTEMSDAELEEFQDKYGDLVHRLVHDRLYEGTVNEISKKKVAAHVQAADKKAVELGRQGMEKYRAGDREGGAADLAKSGKYYKMSSPHSGLGHKKLAGAGVKVPATGPEPGEVKYVITKVGRTPGKKSGMGGQTIHGVTIKDVYTDKAEAQKHAAHLGKYNPVGYEVIRIFDEGVEDQKLGTLAREIEMQVGAHFPDSEGLDAIMSRARKIYGFDRNYPEDMLMDLINDAVKKHLGSDDFYSYVEDFHAQHASDNPEDEDMYEQGMAEAVWDRPSQSYVPRDGRTFGQTNHPREEHCDSCGAATGHAGEDSNVDDEGNVYCDDCYADKQGVAEVAPWRTGKPLLKSRAVSPFGPGSAEAKYDDETRTWVSGGVENPDSKIPVQRAGRNRNDPLADRDKIPSKSKGTAKTNRSLKAAIKTTLDKEQIDEKWGTETKVAPSEKGKYKGKTKAELLKHYNKLKKSGPHKKGSKEYGTMRELSFAIRAKSGWGKVKEAERPSDQVDMGAGLGAGRSNTVLESNMKKTCQAAYHEGKSHGLGGHAYTCRYDEGTDEHMHYHNGFKEGLDECYGIEPMRGVVDETMAATVPGMASQAMDECGMMAENDDEDDESVYYDDEDDYDDESVYDDEDDESVYDDDIDEGVMGGLAGGAIGARLGGASGAMTGYKLGSAAQDALQKEGNAFTGALAKTKKGGKFSLGGHTYTDTSSAFESLDRQLNALLNEDAVAEGISVSISKGQQGGHDSVSVTATDAEAENLLALVKNAGMGIFSDEQKATSDYGAPVSDEGHAEVGDHESILSIMKKMAGIQDSHDSHDYKQEDDSDCGCGQTPGECEEVTEEESEDQMEYEVAEDATEVAMTNADEESEAAEDQAIATADAANAEEEELNEWANEAMKRGTEEAFTTGDEFMLDTISSGLNKKKSTGQTTIPVITGQSDRMGYNESFKNWIKLVS